MAILKGQALWKPENQDKFLFLYMTHEEEVPGHDICWRKVTMYDTRSIRHFFLTKPLLLLCVLKSEGWVDSMLKKFY